MASNSSEPKDSPQKPNQKLGDEYKCPSQTRKVYDNIHGFIYFPQYVWDFIDTPHFQRMRKIKQLSCLEYVFPGATHTRFEHSIGTAHLALTFLNALILNNPQKYKKSEKKTLEQILESARKTITIAGLLHDLGHGPYSHTFDGTIVKKHYKEGIETDWKHQIASVQLFKDLLYNYDLKKHFPQKQQIDRVINLIYGKKHGQRQWQFQIVNNKENGIDVDKLDYFRRDAFHLGAKNIYIHHQLLFKQAKIINGEICYPTKYVEAVYNIFYSRYKLYKNYYFNLVSRGIEEMICDILERISCKFDFIKICSQIYTKPRQYIKLNDNIIDLVEYIRDNVELTKQHYDRFNQAVDLLERVRTRKIYKFVREFHYYVRENTKKEDIKFLQDNITKEKIEEHFALHNIGKNQICIAINEIGFGLTEQNPLKKVGFFIKELNVPMPTKLKSQKLESLSMLYSNAYLQKSIKVFVKEQDQKLFNDVKFIFESYFEEVSKLCKHKGIQNPLEQGPIGTPFTPQTDTKDPKLKNTTPTLDLTEGPPSV